MHHPLTLYTPYSTRICSESTHIGFYMEVLISTRRYTLVMVSASLSCFLSQQENSESGCVPYSTSSDSTQLCQDSVHTLQRDCLSNSTSFNTTDVRISPRDWTQQELEDILTIGIRVVRPSPQCEEVIVPFLCLYYLRPCYGGGEVTYRPSVEDCVTVNTELCPREWAETDDFLSSLGESLPSCEELPTYTSGDCSIAIPGMQTIVSSKL